ncbi:MULTISPECIES: LysR family transcriptional regulator [Enterobacteriaceae]|uniref:LysR family transcriptional regulator n=1 Tax=Enterobacteriaceae TaxID=543 RepID=UPI000272AB3C|nr:LysR family transcriptional regulator [Enterobacter sp. Ag1]EJF33109.1 LysR family transcriptional regulator [Enterobacter sp. Ag1]
MQNMQEFSEHLKIDELAAFAAVVENNGFAGAARVLDRNATVISRRIQHLESRLGTRLLARSTRHVALTEAGELFYRRVRGILDELHNAQLEVSEFTAAPVGNLKISLPLTFGRRWITPKLSAFLAQYPGIHLDVRFTDRLVDLVAEGYDVAIRVGRLTDSALIARTLGQFEYQLVASPAWLGQREIASPADLSEHHCLGLVSHASWPDWILVNGDSKATVRIKGPLQTDNSEALLQAAVDGVGIALVPDWLITTELACGQLVRVLPAWKGQDRGGVYGIMPPGRLIPAKTRLFIDYLLQEMGEKRSVA